MTPEPTNRALGLAVQTDRASHTIAMVAPTLAVLFAAMAVVFALIPGGQRSAVYVGAFAALAAVGYLLNRRGSNRQAAALLVAMLMVAPSLEPLATGDLSTNLAFVGITGVLALMLAEWRYRWWVLVGVTAIGALTIVRTDPDLTVPVTRTGSAASGIALLALSLITGYWLLRSYHTMIERAAAEQRHAEAKAAELAMVNAGLATAVATREAELAEAIAARRGVAEQLARAAVRDPLTGLFNRRYLDDIPPTWGPPGAAALLDVDHFKLVNDTYSYEVGDRVLRTIAATLADQVDEPIILARYGGEEFAVLFPADRAGESRAIVEAMRRAVADVAWDHVQTGLQVTVSIGLCLSSRSSDATSEADALAMLRCADRALAQAKDEGRNRTAATTCLTA